MNNKTKKKPLFFLPLQKKLWREIWNAFNQVRIQRWKFFLAVEALHREIAKASVHRRQLRHRFTQHVRCYCPTRDLFAAGVAEALAAARAMQAFPPQVHRKTEKWFHRHSPNGRDHFLQRRGPKRRDAGACRESLQDHARDDGSGCNHVKINATAILHLPLGRKKKRFVHGCLHNLDVTGRADNRQPTPHDHPGPLGPAANIMPRTADAPSAAAQGRCGGVT